MPKMLMVVIRFIVPSDDHKLKKLLLIYWEVIDKTGPDGKLLPEMILVCNNLRNDLSHPNEYIRGCTLRFLCKLKARPPSQPTHLPLTHTHTHTHAARDRERRSALPRTHSHPHHHEPRPAADLQ